ncbi:hypothetical protein J6590_003965 [Homalodisca vitripennis]|nr:hypothetical protein J6590_003965 [Homalodisca vitripennis]
MSGQSYLGIGMINRQSYKNDEGATSEADVDLTSQQGSPVVPLRPVAPTPHTTEELARSTAQACLQHHTSQRGLPIVPLRPVFNTTHHSGACP